MMKKWLALLLVCVLALSLTACGQAATPPDDFDDFSFVSDTEGNLELEDDEPVNTTTAATTKGDSGKKTTQKTTQKTTKKTGDLTISQNVTIAKGSKPLESGLNFKGEQFTIAIGVTDEVKRLINAFEKKYNCKLETISFDFDLFTQQLGARISSGKSVEICYLDGSQFPTAVIANLFEPLQSGLTTADLYSASKPKAGGIDETRSSFFIWNDNWYGVCGRTGFNSAAAGFIFYNKKMLNSVGAKDPRTLYNEGKWTWDAMKEIGKQVTDESAGIYLGKSQLVLENMTSSNGATYIKYEGSTPKENLTDQRIFNALRYMQDMCSGPDKMVDMDDYSSDGESFFTGKNAFFVAASYNYYNNFKIAEGVLASTEFGKSLDNLGMVPFPLGPDNKEQKRGATSWLAGVASSKGSKDIRAALAWAKFCISYNDPVKPKYQFKAEDQALLDEMVNQMTEFKNYGFSDSNSTVSGYIRKLETNVAYGSDVAQSISDYRKLIQNCITVSLEQQ